VKIFISYSRRDAGDFAEQISKHLANFNYDIFTDIDSITAGDVWSTTIETNISNCDIFVIIVTHGALHSPHVSNEVLQAQREKKRIIPCLHKTLGHSDIKWGLDKIQGIDFYDKFELARNLYSKISRNKNATESDQETAEPMAGQGSEQPKSPEITSSEKGERHANNKGINRVQDSIYKFGDKVIWKNPKKAGVVISVIAVVFAAIFIIVGPPLHPNPASTPSPVNRTNNTTIATTHEIHKTAQNTPAVGAPNMTSSGKCDQTLWNHVYHPERLQIVDQCKTVSGTVDSITIEKDGGSRILLKPDPLYDNLTNQVNEKMMNGDLVVEAICQNPVIQPNAIDACANFHQKINMPPVGTAISATGSYVLDQPGGGYAEIAPVTSILLVNQSSPSVTRQCDPSLWKYVYHPSRLQIVSSCIAVSGRIDLIKAEVDGDDHINLHLDKEFSNLTNDANLALQAGDLVLKPICQHTPYSPPDAISSCKNFPPNKTIVLPKVGSHVKVNGSYVLNLQHGHWAEIHPVTSILASKS
jgi:hypothetical protein